MIPKLEGKKGLLYPGNLAQHPRGLTILVDLNQTQSNALLVIVLVSRRRLFAKHVYCSS